MQGTSLILVLGLVCSGSTQSLWSQLDAVDGQLRQLTAGLTSLTSSVSDRESPVTEKKAFRLAQILDRTQGNGCGGERFRCGNSVQCISRILVCDGSQDCSNGADEEQRICDFPLPVGVNITGYFVYTTCNLAERYGSSREEYWTIKTIQTVDWFGPSTQALSSWWSSKVNIYGTYSGNIEGQVIYTPGDGSMRIDFYDGNNVILVVCTFDDWDRKDFTCEQSRRAIYGTEKSCAVSKWRLQD